MPSIPIIDPLNKTDFPQNFYFLKESETGMPAMVGTPGLSSWLDLSDSVDGPVRAFRIVKGYLYALIGANFYRITDADTYVLLGTVSSSSGPAAMIDNGTQIMVVIFGVNAYVLNLTATYNISGTALSQLTVAASTGEYELITNALGGIVSGNYIGIVGDDGSIQYSDLSKDSSCIIALDDALTDAAAIGNNVYLPDVETTVATATYMEAFTASSDTVCIAADIIIDPGTTPLSDGDAVMLHTDGGTLPTGFSEDTVYYVRNSGVVGAIIGALCGFAFDAQVFQLSTTNDDLNIVDITGVGSGSITIASCGVEVADATGINDGDIIWLELDDGTMQQSTVVGDPISDVIILDDMLTDTMAIGNNVFTATEEETTIAIAALSADEAVDIVVVGSFVDGSNIGITLDDSTVQWTTINGDPTFRLTVTDALTHDSAIGNNVYSATSSVDVFRAISDTDLPAIKSIAYQDSYAIAVAKDTEIFYISDTSGNFELWDPLDYEYVDRLPDNLVGGAVLQGDLWLFGDYSIEPYQDTGASPFPWEKISGADISVGLGASDSIALADNSLFFLDETNRVRRTHGYSTTIISTPKLENAISAMTIVSDAKGFTISWGANLWYVLTFPSEDVTYIFDISASAMLSSSTSSSLVWYKWASFPSNGRHRMNCYTYFNREHLIGDYQNAIIWKLDSSIWREGDNELISILTLPRLEDSSSPIQIDNYFLRMKTGVGLSEAEELALPNDGVNPMVKLEYSNDDGASWVDKGFRPMGKVGETSTIVKWNRLGMTRKKGRIFRHTISDPVERVIYGVDVNV